MDFQPLDTDVFRLAGKPDFENRYPSTVMVTTDKPMAGARCSGVLIGPSLALTAGSCVCDQRRLMAPGGEEGAALIDSSTCAQRAYVTTVVFGQVHDELRADMKVQPHPGTVRPHPELKLVLDERSSVIASHADLAVIALDTPVMGEPGLVPLGQTEVQTGESLVMAGYGYGRQFGQLLGLRYFRKNRVTGVQRDGRILYEQQGAYLYNGFHGGPCFREAEQGRWLVGIASIGAETELACTSPHLHQQWLRSEISRASRALPSQPH